jgi:predicted ATP-binding protein involved in virulence
MRVENLSLQNFRGIRSLELDFSGDRNITVLVGVNGVGKSSILDVISILLLCYEEIGWPRRDVYSGDYIQDSDIHVSQDQATVEMRISHGDCQLEIGVIKTVGSPINYQGSICDQMVDESTLEGDAGKPIVHYLSSRNIKEMTLPARLSDRGWLEFGSSNVMQIYGHYNNATPQNDDSLSSAKFSEFVTWFKSAEDIENEERLATDRLYRDRGLEAVRNAVYSILGSAFTRLKIKRSIGKMVINKEGLEIAVDWLSDGEKSLLAMIGDLAKRLAIANPDMENPLAGEGIVLIDEVDLHMHPAWQRMIVDRLTTTFPNCQFIVTTHSPQVLNHLPPECIYLLEKSGEDILVGHPQYSYGRDSNSILADLMGQRVRPEKIDKELSVLFDLIHEGDLVAARELVASLAEKIGASEPELVRADAVITRKETIGR